MRKLLKFQIVSFLLVVPFLFSSCDELKDCERGSGSIITKTIDINDFHSFNLQISGRIFLKKGETQMVEIEGQENVINQIDNEVKNGEWQIEFRNCMKKYDDLDIYITIPDLEKAAISGSGDVFFQDKFSGNNFDLIISGSGNMDAKVSGNELLSSISGSGDIKITGEIEEQRIVISGSGDVDAFDLPSSKTEVSISGSGSARVTVSETLDVSIAGSGDVFYEGNPTVNSSISGSGKVENVN
ncbi:MAG: DUF2807 domain-containing protein [Flammeovirgaceae bacterium]|nr:DUF2807 domain-containing protein [Flammeovirgaceae bacterium]